MTHSKPQRKRFNRWVIILLAMVVVVSIGAVAIPWGDDNNGNPKPSPTATTPANLGLSGSGAQLASLLSGARQHTFHARYKVSGDPSLLGGTLSLEWWNKPNSSRVDTTRSDGNQTVRTASFVNGGDGTNCQRIDEGDWTCQAFAAPAPGDPQGIITSLTSQLAGRPVTVSNAKISGRSALCFHVGGGTEPIDVCVNVDGVMLRNASSKIKYEISSLDTNVPDATFTPPAKVS